MIEFRLRAAGYNSSIPFFTDEAIAEIYHYTQGYPRRISMLCHNTLKILVMESKSIVDKEIIQDLIANEVKVTI
jgi:general secretion pathway protein A